MKKTSKYIAGFSTISICTFVGYSSFNIEGSDSSTEIAFDPYVCYIDSTYYKSIEEALLASKSGDVIQVIPGNKNRNSEAYTITTNNSSKTVVIPEGVTLNIPYAPGATNSKKANSIDGSHALANRDTFCNSCVIIDENITLENRGTIEIGGIIGAKGGGTPTGCTSGSYSELILDENATLNNYGVLNVYGYIGEKVDGTAHIISRPINSSVVPTINMPMYWYDFGGGSSLKAIYDSIDTYKCLPLDDFYFENIEVTTDIYGGCDVYSWVNLYASNYYGEYDLQLIGSNSNALISIPGNSFLRSNFDSNTLIHKLDFYGDFTINDFAIDVEKAIKDTAGEGAWGFASLVLPSKVSSSEGYFPISYHYDITMNSLNGEETIVDGSKNRFKFLNGSSLKVSDNVTFIAKEMIFYKGDDIYTGRGKHASVLTKSKQILTPSNVIINGKVSAEIISGTINTETTGAELTATVGTNITMYEPKAGEGDNFSAKMFEGEQGWFYVPLTLKLKQSDGEYKDSDIGFYKSDFNDEFYYWNKSENLDIYAVTIDSPSGTSTEAAKEKSFELKANFSPDDYTSEVLSYEWSVKKTSEVGGPATLSSKNESTTILTIPANTSEEKDAFYSVSLKVTFLCEDGITEREVSNTLNFTGAKKSGCFAKGSLILISKFASARVEDLHLGDYVLTFNQFTGRFKRERIAYYEHVKDKVFTKVILSFSDASDVEIITEHCLLNYDTRKFDTINASNAKSFIGNNYLYFDDVRKKFVPKKLVDVKILKDVFDSYTIVTEHALTHFLNNFFSITDGIPGLFNYLTLNDKFFFDREEFEKDLHQFGLYDYDDFSEFLTEYEFNAFRAAYLKIAIGKNLLTKEQIIFYIGKFLKRGLSLK